MKKQLAVLLLVFAVAVGLSGAAAAADFNGDPILYKWFPQQHHKIFFKYKHHNMFFKGLGKFYSANFYGGYIGSGIGATSIGNTNVAKAATTAPQTNTISQPVYAPVYIINSPGAVVNQNINSPSATNAYKSNVDESSVNSPSTTSTSGGIKIA